MAEKGRKQKKKKMFKIKIILNMMWTRRQMETPLIMVVKDVHMQNSADLHVETSLQATVSHQIVFRFCQTVKGINAVKVGVQHSQNVCVWYK